MAIYEITADLIRKIPETTYSLAGLRERYDLQRLLRSQFDVISPDTLIIAEEFGDWDSSHRRINLPRESFWWTFARRSAHGVKRPRSPNEVCRTVQTRLLLRHRGEGLESRAGRGPGPGGPAGTRR